MNYVWIFIGGGLGSMLRFSISEFMTKYNYTFPWATLIANLCASLILGYFLAQALAGQGSDLKKALIMTGFCGGFSTFSTFSVESFELLQNGQYVYAAANILASVIICLIGVFIGYRLGAA